jgi:uncharacterized protein (TIGR00369 family)
MSASGQGLTVSQPLNSPALERVLSEDDPYRSLIGYGFETLGDGRVAVTLAIGPQHCNRAGTLHGGIGPALLTVAGALAIYHADPTVSFANNTAMSLAYLRSAERGRLSTTAEVEQLGGNLAHVSMRLLLDAKECLCTAQAVYRLRREAKA